MADIPWLVCNSQIHRELDIPTLKDVINILIHKPSRQRTTRPSLYQDVLNFQ